MEVASAQTFCGNNPNCMGFTWAQPAEDKQGEGAKELPMIYFKGGGVCAVWAGEGYARQGFAQACVSLVESAHLEACPHFYRSTEPSAFACVHTHVNLSSYRKLNGSKSCIVYATLNALVCSDSFPRALSHIYMRRRPHTCIRTSTLTLTPFVI
eukprot:1462641-Pleurochrysis_carterae.AAC.3